MSSELQGKLALVTGASRGIGAAIADELGRLGATVVGTATTESGAEKISARFKQNTIAGQGMALNVTDTTQIDAVLASIKEAYQMPDILVNNAGITRDNLSLRMKEDEWQDVIDTNLTSIFRISKACLKSMMRNKWGRIINIGSVIGLSGNLGQCNYAAAKAGLIGLSKSLAIEVGSRGVTVNVVAPGFVKTDMTDELPEAERESLLNRIPLRRIADVSEIAAAVSFLASPSAGYITGETINVNGGMYMS